MAGSFSLSFNSNSYFYQNKNASLGGSKNNSFINQVGNKYAQNTKNTADPERRKLISQLNDPLVQTGAAYDFKKTFTATSQNKVNGFLQTKSSEIEDKLKSIKGGTGYKYRQVSAKIQQAKNVLSASSALLSAKRNVRELKNKLASGKGDSEELQIELTHAKRMEMVARKKKRHLEIEEMVENARKLEEKTAEYESGEQSFRSAVVEEGEETISRAEDEISQEREEFAEELYDEYQVEEAAQSGEISEETMAQLNSMIMEFGEEELEKLEQSMEMLESLEVVDPHMSEEDFEDLKRKHRASEDKSMVKANMEYLKDMIKHLEGKSGAPPMQSSQSFNPAPVFSDSSPQPVMSEPVGDMSATPATGIDISV